MLDAGFAPEIRRTTPPASMLDRSCCTAVVHVRIYACTGLLNILMVCFIVGRHIMSHTHKQRQTLMFTATWPMEVQKMAMEFLDNAVRVTIGSTSLSSNKRITQNVYTMKQFDKVTPPI